MAKSNDVRVAIIGAVAMVLVAIIGVISAVLVRGAKESAAKKASGVDFTLTVLDAETNRGIARAATALTVGAESKDGQTDSMGRHIFELSASLAGKPATVRVVMDGYQPQTIEFPVPNANDGRQIVLSKTPTQVAVVTTMLATATSATATITDITTTAVYTAPPEFETTTETYRSGPEASGIGSAFSPWYSLCSPELPERSEILNVAYRLQGDRECGKWSDCRIAERTSRHVCFEFTLQGHNEVFPPRAFMSEGFLTITYKRPPRS